MLVVVLLRDGMLTQGSGLIFFPLVTLVQLTFSGGPTDLLFWTLLFDILTFISGLACQ